MVQVPTRAAYTARMATIACPFPSASRAVHLALHGVAVRAHARAGWQRTPAHS
jgi:hypothetical protein